MDNHVDVLPHLQRLETFEARHLCIPKYPPGTHLPLVQTLRVLQLRCVSIQWMTGQVLPALEKCSIIFPHHSDTIWSVNLPSCTLLEYDSNQLGPLSHFHLPSLAGLEVRCGQWSVVRGSLQLVALYPIFSTARCLTCLHLQVQCHGKLLAFMLRLVPSLEELWLGLTSPHALSKAFFKSFISGAPSACMMIWPARQTIAPLCRGLKRLFLHYRRWFRGLEKSRLILAFGDIVAARQQEESDFSLRLSFGEGPKEQIWKVHAPVGRINPHLGDGIICIGFPSPHGIVPISISAAQTHDSFFSPLFMESEYLQISGYPSIHFPVELLFLFHNLRELRIAGASLTIQPNTQLPSNLSLFHTLKVLHVHQIQTSFLAGQIFHKLESFRYWSKVEDRDPSQGLLTEIPVCTKLDVDLSVLATLKVPQICELGLYFDHPESNLIWETHVVFNANLSRLKLLHMWGWDLSAKIDLIQILRALPALETLIIFKPYRGRTALSVDFFRALVPILGAHVTSEPSQSTGESLISGVLCPRLESLQIENIDLPKVWAKLMPVLKDIVTVRADHGYPLKSFTWLDSGKKWELIRRDESIQMKEVPPNEWFELNI